MKRFRFLLRGLSALLCVAFLAACSGQSGPSTQELRQRLADRIQPVWKVDSFTIEATENQGTNVEPRYRSRFRADVSTVEATYVGVGRFGTADILRQVRPAGDRATVHGFTASRLVEGAWRIEIEVQGDPLSRSGRLRSAFPGRTVIENSAELKAMQEERAKRVAFAQEHWKKLLARGEFRGASSNGRQRWPFVVDKIAFVGPSGFTAEIAFSSLDAVHAVRGTISGEQLVFRNPRAIRRGNASLNCEYTIGMKGEAGGFGVYRCGGFSTPGTVEIAFDPVETIAKRNAERAAALDALRKAVTGTWVSEAPLRNARGEAQGSGPNRIFYRIAIPAGAEAGGEARVTVFTRPETDNRVEIAAKFELTDGEIRWSDGEITLMRDARGNTPWVWSTSNAQWAGKLVDGKLHIAMQGGSRMGQGWTAVLTRE